MQTILERKEGKKVNQGKEPKNLLRAFFPSQTNANEIDTGEEKLPKPKKSWLVKHLSCSTQCIQSAFKLRRIAGSSLSDLSCC